jgi:hypothetical protein
MSFFSLSYYAIKKLLILIELILKLLLINYLYNETNFKNKTL